MGDHRGYNRIEAIQDTPHSGVNCTFDRLQTYKGTDEAPHATGGKRHDAETPPHKTCLHRLAILIQIIVRWMRYSRLNTRWRETEMVALNIYSL